MEEQWPCASLVIIKTANIAANPPARTIRSGAIDRQERQSLCLDTMCGLLISGRVKQLQQEYVREGFITNCRSCHSSMLLLMMLLHSNVDKKIIAAKIDYVTSKSSLCMHSFMRHVLLWKIWARIWIPRPRIPLYAPTFIGLQWRINCVFTLKTINVKGRIKGKFYEKVRG